MTAWGEIELTQRVADRLGPATKDGWPDKRYKTAKRDFRYFQFLDYRAKRLLFDLNPEWPDGYGT